MRPIPFVCGSAPPDSTLRSVTRATAKDWSLHFDYGLFRAIGAANEQPIVCDLLQPHERASAFGFINGFNNAAGGAAVLASGYIKQATGLGSVFSMSSIFMLVAGFLCFYGYRKWMCRDIREVFTRMQIANNAPSLHKL